ncbi:M48 family metallopeptidase [Hyphomicrobium sp.]|uniref:M48 family metallopeptidase n=1 Tax=Hyphomicrobium sp. TaxID=82 RepID=UPI002D79F580|nr:M48 family metallopeptidase [Hyphomicrobium sp.]HET6389061.1 M48 family metallopeptidase [Hyphomicrobium sp.]
MPSDAAPEKGSQSYCRFVASRGSPPLDGTAFLGPAGVEFDLGSGQPRHIWSYGRLRSEEPIRTNAIDVLLTSKDAPGASLFVQGARFAADLRARAPQLSARAAWLREKRFWFVLLAVLAALVVAAYMSGISPAKSIAQVLPDGWRQRLGNVSRESMTEGHKECIDPAGVAALKRLTERLAKGLPAKVPFDVHVYDWPLMNAFAVPGGQIILTKGLLDKSQTPDETAGVLAHEMGHGIELHPEAAIIRGVGLGATLEIILGGTPGGGLANVGLMLAQLGYSRRSEREADTHALELLKAANISPKGLGEFFSRVTKLEAEHGDKAPGGFRWFRTHPPPAERARLVSAQQDYPATPALDASDWEALKSICRTTRAPEDAT